MTVAAALALAFGCGLTALLALWFVSLTRRDASIVDIWWGPGFGLLSTVAYAVAPAPGPRGALLLGLVWLWGLRLGGHLAWRNHGRGEDPRYAAMRRRHGDRFGLVSLGTVFALQGALQWLVALPVLVALLVPGERSLGTLDAIGLAVFVTGLAFEAIGDAQLARFKADPANAGRVMDRGLWRYTRHPNYFGDSLVWWGLFTIACATPCGIYLAASPALMTYLLLRVSGVPLLERSLVRTRPAYRDYVETTSAFFPRPPRKNTP